MPSVDRLCDGCGQLYRAQRLASRYCSSRCRNRASRARRAGQVLPTPAQDEPQGAVEGAIRAQLQGLPASSLTAAALVLAGRIDRAASSPESGSSLAAMVRELRATVAEATRGRVPAIDPVDELRAKRERRLRLSSS